MNIPDPGGSSSARRRWGLSGGMMPSFRVLNLRFLLWSQRDLAICLVPALHALPDELQLRAIASALSLLLHSLAAFALRALLMFYAPAPEHVQNDGDDEKQQPEKLCEGVWVHVRCGS